MKQNMRLRGVVLAVLVFTAGAVLLPAQGSGFIVDPNANSGFTYTKDASGKGIIILGYVGPPVNLLQIPNYIDSLPVTELANNAFCRMDELVEIRVPNSVVRIGTGCFQQNLKTTKLRTVVLSPNIKRIEADTFRNCRLLMNVDIPAGVTSIGERAFNNCNSLPRLNLPEGITRIENAAFSGCSNFKEITFPKSVTSIGEEAFFSCTKVTSITVPSTITKIEAKAFARCVSVTTITIPDSVTSIGDEAFSDYPALTTINVNIRPIQFGENVFYNCPRLSTAVRKKIEDCGYSWKRKS
ncbi:MAG: leucine-rich repeat domain-containing protein [Treponema sp.]|jgi:hypothetical protein|nr:leucine-rich repeat domain-containing protein [Treponema sp.]